MVILQRAISALLVFHVFFLHLLLLPALTKCIRLLDILIARVVLTDIIAQFKVHFLLYVPLVIIHPGALAVPYVPVEVMPLLLV